LRFSALHESSDDCYTAPRHALVVFGNRGESADDADFRRFVLSVRTAVSIPIVPPRITEKGYDFLEQYEKRYLFLFQRWCKAIAGITGVIAAIIAIAVFLASSAMPCAPKKRQFMAWRKSNFD